MKRIKLSRTNGWWVGPKGLGFQYYLWPDKAWKVPQIAVGACSHGTRVALWVEAGRRSGVLLAPYKTNWQKQYYWILCPKYQNRCQDYSVYGE